MAGKETRAEATEADLRNERREIEGCFMWGRGEGLFLPDLTRRWQAEVHFYRQELCAVETNLAPEQKTRALRQPAPRTRKSVPRCDHGREPTEKS
jgi:hypothetical protein